MNIPKAEFSKFIVTLVVILNLGFTAVVLYIFYRTGKEPDVLTGAWFAFTTGELWMLSKIKRTKVVNDRLSSETVNKNRDL